MTVVDAELIVQDATGRLHRRNPLGGHACLGCTLPFPCPSALAGEQLELGVDLVACRCGGVHEARVRPVQCRRCDEPTLDFHRLCPAHEHEVMTT